MDKHKNTPAESGISSNARSLILKHINLVRYVAGKMGIYFKKEDEEDMVGYGILGLIEAARRFDVSKGVQFNTYAVHRIKGAIVDHLRAQDWLPRSLRKKESDIKDVRMMLERTLQREPEEREIAEALGVSIQEFQTLQSRINFDYFVSLDDLNYNDEGEQTGKFLGIVEDKNGKEAPDILEEKEEKEKMLSLIQKLPEMERLVITLYYYEDMLVKEIGKVLGISESRVSQLHHKALFYLKTKMQKGRVLT